MCLNVLVAHVYDELVSWGSKRLNLSEGGLQRLTSVDFSLLSRTDLGF